MDYDFIVNKWIPALRSGKYTQGRNMLRTKDNTFCCLGVACDLIDPEGWSMGTKFAGEKQWAWKPKNKPGQSFAFSMPPISLQQRWFGRSAEGEELWRELPGMNDGVVSMDSTMINRKTFNQIADELQKFADSHKKEEMSA